MTHTFDATVLREYDIRGIIGETLGEGDAYAIGRGFATLLGADGGTTIAVGYDGRTSSPMLEAALVRGINDAGLDVPAESLDFVVRAGAATTSLTLQGTLNHEGVYAYAVVFDTNGMVGTPTTIVDGSTSTPMVQPTISISLPLPRETAVPPAITPMPSVEAESTLRILVVEDERALGHHPRGGDGVAPGGRLGPGQSGRDLGEHDSRRNQFHRVGAACHGSAWKVTKLPYSSSPGRRAMPKSPHSLLPQGTPIAAT